jgi:hypothetical protein
MNTTRFLKITAGATLALAALIVLLTFQATTTSGNSGGLNVGMGDLHLYDAQEAVPDTGAPVSGNKAAGMGDLRWYEAQVNSRNFTGMGDLHRYEAQQAILDTGVRGSSLAVGIGDLRWYEAQVVSGKPVGMGDLHRFEASNR